MHFNITYLPLQIQIVDQLPREFIYQPAAPLSGWEVCLIISLIHTQSTHLELLSQTLLLHLCFSGHVPLPVSFR
jgi:hypothetical protein